MSRMSYIKATAYQLLPQKIQSIIHAFSDDRKMKHWQECFKVKVSEDQVNALFEQMSLDADVMIHSSLPDIGNIKLKHITACLKDYVLDGGHTILCPALPIKGSSLDYLKSIREFDVRTAPNAMGTISTYYARQEGAKRSLSPTHSVVAFGAKAEFYIGEHHLSETPFTEKSPYFRIMLEGGRILMFGASLKNLTFNHVVEDMIGEELFPVHVYDPEEFEIDLINEDGFRMKGVFRAHSHKSGRLRDSAEVMDRVLNLPSTRTFPLGCGEVILLDARDVCLCLLNSLQEGLTTMGRRRVSDKCRQKAGEWIYYIQDL